ncbi:hypothetical protein ACFQU7_42625 [Pseudoroseomonas wenyumeiae]
MLPPSAPGLWKQVPGFIADPLGPLAIRWRHLARSTPWLLRYLAAGWTEERVRQIAETLRPLLKDSPALHGTLAREAGVPELIEHKGLMNAWHSRAGFAAEAMGGASAARSASPGLRLRARRCARWSPTSTLPTPSRC